MSKNNNHSWISKDLIGFSLTSLFNDLSHEMTTSILPLFIEQIAGPSSAPFALGIIMGFADASSTAMKLISGWLADRLRYFKPILVIGYALTPIFVSLIGTAQYVWQIFLYQTLAWMGRGLREPMRDVWLSNITSAQHYGKAFGFQRACDTLGAMIGPIIAFFTIKIVVLRYNFFIAFIPGFISILSVLLLTSHYQKTSHRQTMSWRAQIAHLPANFIYFMIIMFVFGIGNFNKTFFIYRAQNMLYGQTNSLIIATGWAILLYTLFNASRAIAELGIGSLSDYIDRTILLSLFGFALFGLTTVLLLFAHDQLLLWILIFIGAGFSTGTITSVEKSYAAQLLPESVRGIGFGLLQSIDGFGDLLSSAIAGGLWSYIAPEIAFIYAAFLSFIPAILLLVKYRSSAKEMQQLQ